MTSPHSSISPTANTTDVVFAADGGLEAEMDEEELKDLFSDEAEAPLLQPSVEDRGLADGTEGLTATEEDLEGAVHKILPDPGEPTAAEVEDHRACGHIPYRSWCKECVESRGLGEPHRAHPEQRKACVFAFDYMFIGKDGLPVLSADAGDGGDEENVKLLVAKDTRGKAIFAHVIPQKGVDQDHYSVDVLVKDILWLG